MSDTPPPLPTPAPAPPAAAPPQGPIWTTLLVTAFMLVLTLVVGWYLLGHIDGLRQQNAALARFFVLSFLALSVAAVLFGVLRATGQVAGQQLGLNVAFGGPAAVFLVVLLIGMQIVTPDDKAVLSFALQPKAGESMTAVSGKVKVLVDLGSQSSQVTFGDLGRATVADVPPDILEEKKVAIRVESDTYRLPTAANDASGKSYLAIGPNNQVDIPLERIPPAAAPVVPVSYKECRTPANGIETAEAIQPVSRTSHWMGGGYDPTKWCNDVTTALRATYPDAEFRVTGTGENKKSTCEPFNCPQYQYRCDVEVKIGAVYKLARAPACGPA